MKKILLTLAVIASSLVPAAAVLSSGTVYADAFNSSNAKNQVCSGINGSAASGGCTAPGKSVNEIIKTVLNLLSALIGIVAVVMVMVSGFKFVTAGGDASKVSAARSTLTYAIIGLVIVAFAQFITQFVLKQVTK
ncbi:MAG TPA: pilin [Patescibacteria group bacterium]|nr:pilin [Patescibacteria group bacterium]